MESKSDIMKRLYIHMMESKSNIIKMKSPKVEPIPLIPPHSSEPNPVSSFSYIDQSSFKIEKNIINN